MEQNISTYKHAFKSHEHEISTKIDPVTTARSYVEKLSIPPEDFSI